MKKFGLKKGKNRERYPQKTLSTQVGLQNHYDIHRKERLHNQSQTYTVSTKAWVHNKWIIRLGTIGYI